MANIKLMRGSGVTLTNPAVVDGQLLFDTGNKSIWIDVGTTRYKLYDQLDTAVTDISDLKTLVGTESVAKQIADKIAELKAASVTAVENTNTVTLTLEGSDTKTLKADVKVSVKADNLLKNRTDSGEEGLYVAPAAAAPEYSITKAETPETGFAATYYLTKDGAQVGAKINIDKDKFLQSASVVKQNGSGESGTFIKMVFNDDDTSAVYIDVKDLVDVYTTGSASGDMIMVAVSEDNKITATITDGTVTKAKLHVDVQTSLGKADTAVQPTQLVLSATEGKYVAGIAYSDGSFSLVEKDLPDVTALSWNDFSAAGVGA